MGHGRKSLTIEIREFHLALVGVVSSECVILWQKEKAPKVVARDKIADEIPGRGKEQGHGPKCLKSTNMSFAHSCTKRFYWFVPTHAGIGRLHV